MKRDITDLQNVLSSDARVFREPSSLKLYSFDQGEVPSSLKRLLIPDTEPDLVVQPGTAADLQACVRYGLEKNIPLVPRGASTFGMGGAVAHQGGILLDFSASREILDFDAAAQTVRVSAGCRWSDVSQFLESHGMELCTYPTSWFSTVGGWASTGGIGIGCTGHGNFHDLIRGITVVDATGEMRSFSSTDPELRFYLGTEGQMGAIYDVTFAVRPRPAFKRPFLLLFDSPAAALETAGELLANYRPYHLKYLSAERMHEINHLLREEHAGLRKEIEMPEKDALLACFETDTAEFQSWIQKKALLAFADYRAHYLWRERMFPLRVKRVAPGLLASEVVLPIGKVAEYAEKAKSLARKFHVHLAVECYFLNDGTALTLPVYTYRAGGMIDEAIKASLAYVLTATGIRMGGRPYGAGIWNTPFVKDKLQPKYRDFAYYKNSKDPKRLMNPGKYFDFRFRTGIAGRMAALPLRRELVGLWTPLLPAFASMLTRNAEGARPADLILENEELCSKCGSCIPVCPAYIDTRDERTTARGKLQLGKQILNGGTLTAEAANTLFLCMHCGACTDVCQSRLDLVPVWDELEKRVAQIVEKDVPRIASFVKSVEKRKLWGPVCPRCSNPCRSSI